MQYDTPSPGFTAETFHTYCDKVAAMDPDLASIITRFGYPPFWSRPNTYETMVHFILEQQVSLASAKAALEKLRTKVGIIVPENVMPLTDEEFKAVYFSKQKTGYTRGISSALLEGTLDITNLEQMGNDAIRQKLIQLKGVGNWTIDVYLIMVLHRLDVFPIGDIALVNALKRLKNLPPETTKEALLAIAGNWAPYRTIAAMLLWHYYLSRKQALS